MIGSAVIVSGTIAGAVLTRRSAKDTNAVEGYDKLTGRLTQRVERLEQRETERDERDQKHQEWDRVIYDQARAAGWDVAPPPPLG